MTIRFDSLPIATSRLEITSPFGQRSLNDAEEPHNAVDIRGAEGTPLLAVSDGTVHRIIKDNRCGTGIVLLHNEINVGNTLRYGRPPQYTTTYCHMRENSISEFNLQEGASVRAGQIVGRVGMTGRTYGPHLHFALKRVNRGPDSPGDIFKVPDTPIDPAPYLGVVDQRASAASRLAKTTIPSAQPTSGMSPYIASLGSFHPNIQYELNRRQLATETANTHIPFIKLTSLLKVDKENLNGATEAWCPTLGIHGQSDETFDNIYFPKQNNSIVGYATTKQNGKFIRVPVVVQNFQTDAENIPVPGITNITTERSTSGPMGVRGGLFRANITIVAYSVGQMNALLKYFLRPSTNVLLEFGRVSSSNNESRITPFNWNRDKDIISRQIANLITDQQEQEKFIKETVYGNYGNYEALVGYVANFNFKYTKNNTYEITLTVHSVQQFEVPTIHTGAKATCTSTGDGCKVFDIKEYFDESYSWKTNSFKRLLEAVESGTLKEKWENHIIPLRQSESKPNKAKSGTHNAETNTRGGYLISWEFFVNVLLNDEQHGVASVLPLDSFGLDGIGFIKSSFLKPVVVTAQADDNQLISSEVGYHPYLRSVNPGIMVIYNPVANGESEADATTQDVTNVLTNENVVLENSTISERMRTSVVGAFTNISGDNLVPGTSLLTKGVWLNSDAIIQAFTSNDSVTAALNYLLTKMNSATEGYWNLQLLSNDNKNSGLHVIDAGLSKNKSRESLTPLPANIGVISQITNSLTNKKQLISSYYGDVTTGSPKYTYVFNRKLQVGNNDDIGSDLLDINVEFGLPTMIAVQAIAGVGGVAQKSAWQAIDVEGLNKLKLLPDLYVSCSSGVSQSVTCPDDPILRLETQLKFAREDVQSAEARQRLAGSEAAYRTATVKVNEATEEQARIQNELAGIRLNNPNLLPIIREYNHLGNALKFIEFNPSQMVMKLNADSDNKSVKVHAFNSSNLTKTLVDLTLPGIGGIQLWQAFLVDRIPSILNQGYYVVVKVAHEFTIDRGWITKIQGRFRYQPKDN